MMFTSCYSGMFFEDLETIFQRTNVEFYEYITSMGLDIDLSKKDQQKIYLHHFITYICEALKVRHNKTVFYINTFNICNIHATMIKKIKRIFGIRIWEHPETMRSFVTKLEIGSADVVDIFEVWLNTEHKPKSFRHIKKYLEKEGFTNLADSYFQDMVNKMLVCG